MRLDERCKALAALLKVIELIPARASRTEQQQVAFGHPRASVLNRAIEGHTGP